MSIETVHVVAQVESKEGEEAFVREVLQGFLAPTRAEKGCIKYNLFVDASDPKKFTFIEEWASAEDLKVHSESEHLKSGIQQLTGKLVAPASVQSLKQI